MKDKMSLLIGAASLALVSRKRTEGNRNTSAEAEYISIWLDNLLLNYQMTFDPQAMQTFPMQANRMQELTKARAQSFKDGVLSFATMNRNVLVKECYDSLETKMNLASFTSVFNKVLDQKILQEATQ